MSLLHAFTRCHVIRYFNKNHFYGIGIFVLHLDNSKKKLNTVLFPFFMKRLEELDFPASSDIFPRYTRNFCFRGNIKITE